jgi:phosphatidylinositol-3-phosphatase
VRGRHVTPVPLRPVALVCAALLALTGCATTTKPASDPEASGAPAPSSGTPDRAVSEVLVLVVENHSLDEMRTQMPYTFSLAERYGYTTAYRALTHPSLGNYIAIAGGSTFGITDDDNPVAHLLSGPSVFSEATGAGRTAAVYAEGMPDNCSLTNGGDQYVVRHNPWTYFVDDRADCNRYDVPATQLAAAVEAGRLPNIAMVIPDLCNDAHDCPLSTADDWLRSTLDDVFAGPDWRSGHLAVVVTADEDDHHQDNLVLTTVMHPGLDHVVVDEPLSHLSLSRFLSEVIDQPPLRDAADARSLGDAFGLHTAG